MLQHKGPSTPINAYLDGFHFYNLKNTHVQQEAHHYASRLNKHVHQALIYDGNGEDAKIMGVEYVISERLFKTLYNEEMKLWYSHRYEVKSEALVWRHVTFMQASALTQYLQRSNSPTWFVEMMSSKR